MNSESTTVFQSTDAKSFVATNSTAALTLTPWKFITFAAGEKQIQVDISTGAVKLSDGLSLDDASLLFWRSLAKSLPHVRQEIIDGHHGPIRPTP